MNTKNMRVLGAFALCTFAELLGEITGDHQWILYSKPLLMPLLGVWLFLETRDYAPQFRNMMLLGLFFATLGDTLCFFRADQKAAFTFCWDLGLSCACSCATLRFLPDLQAIKTAF